MYLLVFLRFLLGHLSRTTAPSRRLCAIPKAANQPAGTSRTEPRGAIPYEWINMDYVLTKSFPPGSCGIARGTFERPTHPLGSILRFARRLAGVPMPYPALAVTVCLANRQSGRDQF